MRVHPLFAAAAIAGGVAVGVAAPAVAQSAAGPDLAVTLKGGAGVAPEYFGADSYTLAPRGAVALNYLRFGGREIGSLDPATTADGLRLRGAFRVVPERTSGEDDELEGLDEIDTAVELGLGLGYSTRRFDAFADLRYGVTGHESLVAALGADAKYIASDRLTLTLGPRLDLGSEDFARTYFGVSEGEATVSDFDAYDPSGGLVSAGVELGARYDLNGPWGVEGAVTWDRFVGDAGDSPIVEAGNRDQFGARLQLTRQITFAF